VKVSDINLTFQEMQKELSSVWITKLWVGDPIVL
jgi:hypothetical protein